MRRPDPEWQRATAIRKVREYRDEAREKGQPMVDATFFARAAAYVGATAEQVRRWA